MPNEASKVQCLGCRRIYNKPPLVEHEDGHGGRMMEMCRCRSDLFAAIEAKTGGEDDSNAISD